ncbi:transmembrane protein, putative [Bodo saltans]|uniref:Transmembrane protein, putative n=1 Tax=Bodo saltans TaxID=75058 RepID=A0A0S4J322_BODSA|nr:transmembrane protein, putative [Bodo saltans]|eukprot:CUG63666.1 transmembrane protein, putative [Bodo saltans]
MRILLKVVIVGLILMTSGGVILCSFLPTALRLQQDVLTFVSGATAVASGMQFMLSHRFGRMESACHTMYRAAAESDQLGDLTDVWKFADWAGPVVEQLDIGSGLLLPDGRGIRVSSQNDATQLPGFILITNITSPGLFADVGQFQLYTQAPANPVQPWTRVYTDVQWNDIAAAPDITNPNRSSPMQWARVSPLNIYPSWTTESMLVIGGPVFVKSALDPAKRLQFLFLEHRGEWLTQYFSEVNVSSHGFAILMDVVSGAFVAGSISDPTGTTTPDGVAHLQLVRDLNDERIKSFLAARVVSFTTPGIHGGNGSRALLECPVPCVLTHWPSDNEIRDSVATTLQQQPHLFDAFKKSFSVTSVVQITGLSNGLDILNLRLAVTIPADDVAKELIDRVASTGVYLLVAVVASCVITIGAVTVLLRDLSGLEAEMLRMAKVFSPHHLPAKLSDEPQSISGTFVLQFAFLVEFSRIAVSLRRFSRELHTIRAFSSAPVVTTSGTSSATVTAAPSLAASPVEASLIETSGGNTNFTALTTTQHSIHDDVADDLYVTTSRKPWRVPVTTVMIMINPEFLGGPRDDPVHLHQRHFSVLSVLKKQATAIRGSFFVDMFTGDCVLLHFNAFARTPKHVVAALNFVLMCQATINDVTRCLPPCARTADENGKETAAQAEDPVKVFYGISSAVAHCGIMGPRKIPSFHVISVGVTQAGFMARVAKARNRHTMITWRAVDIARQQQSTANHLSSSRAFTRPREKGEEEEGMMERYVFTPVAQVVSPGELLSSIAYAVDERSSVRIEKRR